MGQINTKRQVGLVWRRRDTSHVGPSTGGHQPTALEMAPMVLLGRGTIGGGGEGGYGSGGVDRDGSPDSSHRFSNSLTIGRQFLGTEWTCRFYESRDEGVELFVESPSTIMFVVEPTVVYMDDQPHILLVSYFLAYSGQKGPMGSIEEGELELARVGGVGDINKGAL